MSLETEIVKKLTNSQFFKFKTENIVELSINQKKKLIIDESYPNQIIHAFQYGVVDDFSQINNEVYVIFIDKLYNVNLYNLVDIKNKLHILEGQFYFFNCKIQAEKIKQNLINCFNDY